MPGAAKTRKEYYINVNKEAIFKTEPVSGNQTAVSGEIQETPSFKPSNEPIRTKKHSELGAISNVLKGAFRGTLSFSETIQDWRPLARLLGNTIDMIRIIKGLEITGGTNIQTEDIITQAVNLADATIYAVKLPIDGITGGTGTFVVGETVTYDSTESATVERVTIASGATSGTIVLSGMSDIMLDGSSFQGDSSSTTAVLNIPVGAVIDIWLTQFTKDEELTFAGSGADETFLAKIEGNVAHLFGTPDQTVVDTDVMTGQTSGARYGITTVTSQSELILTPFDLTNSLSIDTATPLTFDTFANAPWSFVYQHQLAVVREQNSYALNYAYVSLDNQHVMTGCVMKQVGLESAVNEAPKFAIDWLLSTRVTDPTRDAEVLNTLALYEYVDMSSLSIDASTQDGTSVDWTDILKSFSATFNRSNLVPVDSHTTQAPTGMKGPEVESTLSFEIHEQDATIWNLNLGTTDDDFAVALTFARGISGEDDAVVTYPANRAYEVEEAGEETILLTVPVEVKGTPTVVINDTTPDYST